MYFHGNRIAQYCKIPKISHRPYYFSKDLFEGLIKFRGAYIWRGLSNEVNLHFKFHSASLIVGMKFTVFALFCFVFEGNFQVQAHRGPIFGGAI